MIGFVTSILINFWLGIGSVLWGKKPVSKPFSQDLCLNSNNTSNFTLTSLHFTQKYTLNNTSTQFE